MQDLLKTTKTLIWLTALTGVAYPLLILGIAQIAMPKSAGGSLIYKDGKPIGSELIAQNFQNNSYFWPRPSAIDYNPMKSGGSNLSPTSRTLKEIIEKRKKGLSASHSSDWLFIPSDLLFASGSGLDPHISPEAAYYQVVRVAKARNLTDQQEELYNLIDRMTIRKPYKLFGKSCVNVLLLNLALDQTFMPSTIQKFEL